ncbi:MAG: MmcQ/YjbR family DNA-binding protein [Myxococcota bacterium]
MSSRSPAAAYEALLAHALALPEAWLDHPWGETCVKVKKKVFVFLRHAEDAGDVHLTAKLPASGHGLLKKSWAEPTGYGLGKHGWVSLRLGSGELLPHEELVDLIEESYQAVAPKRLGRLLDPDDDD